MVFTKDVGLAWSEATETELRASLYRNIEHAWTVCTLAPQPAAHKHLHKAANRQALFGLVQICVCEREQGVTWNKSRCLWGNKPHCPVLVTALAFFSPRRVPSWTQFFSGRLQRPRSVVDSALSPDCARLGPAHTSTPPGVIRHTDIDDSRATPKFVVWMSSKFHY